MKKIFRFCRDFLRGFSEEDVDNIANKMDEWRKRPAGSMIRLSEREHRALAEYHRGESAFFLSLSPIK